MKTLSAIRFVELTAKGDREIGRARLSSGGVRLIGLPPRLADDLRAGGAIDAKRRRVYPKDGRRFLRACLHQFRGSYIRAIASERS